jgi:hypothetical protein
VCSGGPQILGLMNDQGGGVSVEVVGAMLRVCLVYVAVPTFAIQLKCGNNG